MLTISCLLITSGDREKASFDQDIVSVSDGYIVALTTKAISNWGPQKLQSRKKLKI